ncbi:MAG TPA: molybdopterin cofactor-binding domain-containing protein [Candidatus Dormibacteraeota bacterium]|nr:molybdopterin cofactor-binding domain-containing protein [Candidatus Dormibacteraeota bacterium]
MKPRNSSEPIMAQEALGTLHSAGFSRRNFLKGSGMLVVSFSMAGLPVKLRAAASALVEPLDVPLGQVDSWIAIAQDESVTAYSGKCEFGQGFRTVQYQLIADELYVPLDRITLILCDTDLTPDQGITSGSQSHPTEFGLNGLRQALATAREKLFQMAAAQFAVSVDELTVQDGVISVTSQPSRNLTYGQLIGGQQFNIPVNHTARPKDPRQYTVLGTPLPRYEIPAKVTGQFEFVQMVRQPGMLHGKVVRPPTVGAKVLSVDESSVQNLPGNVRVIVKKDFVGVVADKEFQARNAVGALVVRWSPGVGLPNQADLYDYMRQQASRDSYTVLSDDVDQKFEQAAHVVAATYLYPFQMHGSLGSSCAVADVQGSGPSGKAMIWSASQGVYPQRNSVALVLGIPKENIRVLFVEGSGCYGLNGADTVCFDAALLSQAVGKPVRVQLTRKDEMTSGESFGPAYVVDLRAALDDQNRITAWDYEGWTLDKGNRPNATAPGNIITGALVGFPTPPLVPGPGEPPTSYRNNGNAGSSYGAGCVNGICGGTGTISSERVLTHTIGSPFFTGPLRSPARLQNTFANESFIDEVAAFVKDDPVQFRLRYLGDARLIDALNAAAKDANWDTRPSPKPGNPRTGIVSGRGVSCVLYEGNNGYCALVAEVEVDQVTGKITVTRLVASQDSGPVSNPDGLRNQMEGGALQGMSRALREEITWDPQKVTSLDWVSYPVLRFGEPVPVVETALINRVDKPQTGAGECTITLVAAAIANAVFDATGARLRQVPFTPERVLSALNASGSFLTTTPSEQSR